MTLTKFGASAKKQIRLTRAAHSPFCLGNSTPPALLAKANMRVKIRGADDFLDVGQPVDYAKLMTQVTSTNLFLQERTLSPPELR